MIDLHGRDGVAGLGDGRVLMHGTAARLFRWFDERFVAMARDSGATECRFPATVARTTLARAGYFDAFPDGAAALASRDGRGEYCLCPAVCYHAYQWVDGRRLDAPLLLTAAQSCVREGDRAAAGASRLWEFTMREIIVLGEAAWVTDQIDAWAARIERFSGELGLAASLVAAADPFFGPEARGRRLLQQVKGLKRELRIPFDDGAVAVASFNRHETFFSSRFGFEMAGGRAAHSGCVAFGLERWVLAWLARHGAAAAVTLVGD